MLGDRHGLVGIYKKLQFGSTPGEDDMEVKIMDSKRYMQLNVKDTSTVINNQTLNGLAHTMEDD